MCIVKEVDINLEDVINVVNTGYYFIQNQPVKLKYSPEEFEKSIVILPDRIQSIFNDFGKSINIHIEDCKCGCYNVDSLDYAIALKTNFESNVLVHNLANPFSTIRSIRKTARTQEENLCFKTSLLYSLRGKDASQYYSYNKSLDNPNESCAMVITPFV